MNRRNVLRVSAISALGLALFAGNAAAQSANDLVGTWTPVSVDAYGPNPKGSLIFDANGRYSLQLMKPNLPKYQSNNRTQGSPAEYKITVEGILSHFGTYSVSGTDLIYHIEASSFPNWAAPIRSEPISLSPETSSSIPTRLHQVGISSW